MSSSETNWISSPACTMTDSGAATNESGYATDNSCANSTLQVLERRLGPFEQLDSIKCCFETKKLPEDGLPEISYAGKLNHTVEGHEDNVLEHTSNELGCGSLKCLGAMKFNSQSVFKAVSKCEGSSEQNLSEQITKKLSWSGSSSPSVSPSISDLGGRILYSTPSEFSDCSSLLCDYPPSCTRVTSTPFSRSTTLQPMVLQEKHIRQSSPSLNNTKSPYFTLSSQPNSPKPCHHLQRNTNSSLCSFTSDYFSTSSPDFNKSSIAMLTTLSDLQNTPGRPVNSSNSMARGKASKNLVWPPWTSSVDDAEHNPDQPVNLSCQSLPSDYKKLLKCSPSHALPREKYLISQEISSDSALHSSYSSNLSNSFATTELESCSFPGLLTDHLLIKSVPEQSFELKQYLRRNDKNSGSCGGKCTSSFCRRQNVSHLEGFGELVTCSQVSEYAGSKTSQNYECLQPNPDMLLTKTSSIQNCTTPPTPPSNRLVRSASSPNLSPQTSVNDAPCEEEPSCRTSTSIESLFDAKFAALSSFLLLPSAHSQSGIRKCMQSSRSTLQIQDVSETSHWGSISNNTNVSHTFLSAPDLSPFKRGVEHSLQERKTYNFISEPLISPVYTERSVDHPSNSTTAVTKPPISIVDVTSPPISLVGVTSSPITNDTTKLPKHTDAVVEMPNKVDPQVNASTKEPRAEAKWKNTSTDNDSAELYGTLLNNSQDSLILPCPDNCKTYPVSPSLVLNSNRHPLNITHAKRNLGLNDLQLKLEDSTNTDVEFSCRNHHMHSSSYVCNQKKFADKNNSASPLLLGVRLLLPKVKQLESGYTSEGSTSISARRLQHTNNKAHNLSIPSTPSPLHLSIKPPICPRVSSLVHSNTSCPNFKTGSNNKQSGRHSLLHNCCITTTESKITLPNDNYLLSRRPCVAEREQDHLVISLQGMHKKEQGISDHTNSSFTHAKLDFESDLPKTQTALLASPEPKWPHQPLHHFNFLPLVTASPAVRRAALSVVTLLMEEAPYLLPAVLRYLGPRDLVAVTRTAKQLRSVVMETTSLLSTILEHAQSVRVLGKENISFFCKMGYSPAPASRAALNQLNRRCVAIVQQAGDQPPPRERPQQCSLPILTGRNQAKRSPRKILGVIQSAVSSLQAAISPNKATMRVHAAKAAKPLKGSKILTSIGSGSVDERNNSIKSSAGADRRASDKIPTSPPCQCPQCLAASHSKWSRTGATARDHTSAEPITNERMSGDFSNQTLDKSDGGSGRCSRTADGSGSLVCSRSTNNVVFAKDDSPTKFSPIKLNIFAKSTKKRLRRL